MEQKILTGLKHIGYDGPLIEKGNLKMSIEYGPKNVEYTKLVHFLTNELRTISNIDEAVNPIIGPEDSSAFVMETTSFLRELNCPYKALTQGHASDRLQNVEDRQVLLDYLITELMTARIMQETLPKKKMELKLHESQEASDLKQILICLGFSKPPADITLQMLFQKLWPAVENLAKKAGDELIGKPFFSGFLSEKQWQTLADLQKDLNTEYKIRREMLLTRLDVTIQSFQWSDRTKGKEIQFETIYKDKRKNLTVIPDVDISHLLSARSDIAIIEKTSSSKVRKNTGTSIHKVIIGQVPDRGGRTNELAPPPPEMPSWQQRTPGPAGGNRGGFHRGGGGQQHSSRGGQSTHERGNNIARPNYGYAINSSGGGGFKSSFTNNDKKPFSNFDTSLSLYASSSTSNFSSSYGRGNGDSRQSSNSFNGPSRSAYSKPFDSAGSYDNPNKRPRSSSNNDYGSSVSYSQKRSFDLAGDHDNRGNYSSSSNAGNYESGNYSSRDNAPTNYDSKKAKSYDNFQTNQSTYSDQYVKDAQNNQQYQRRGSGRGRSNYHRGRGQDVSDGVVEALHIQNATLDILNVTLPTWRRLRYMTITDGHIRSVIGEFSKLTFISCLNLSSNSISKFEERSLVTLYNLSYLDLSYNNLTEVPRFKKEGPVTLDISNNDYILCSSVLDALKRAELFFNNENNTICSSSKTFHWFNSTEHLPLIKIKGLHELSKDCDRLNYNCTCEPSRVDLIPGKAPIFAIDVNCSNRGLKKLPTPLPPNTIVLNITNNNITSLEAVNNDPSYRHLRELYADNNEIVSVLPLEGSKFIGNFVTLSLRNNKIRSLPTYMFSNAFDRNYFLRSIHLGLNYVQCDCNAAKNLKVWLLTKQKQIPDYKDIYCENMNSRVMDLTPSKLCQSKSDWTDYVYYIITFQVLLLVSLIGKVFYDYWIFKTAGYLPWPASKMPKMPCDWLCE